MADCMISDATPEGQRVYRARFGGISAAERVALSTEMIEVTDELVRAGVRLRYPEADEQEISYQVLRVKYGAEVAGQVYGRAAGPSVELVSMRTHRKGRELQT